MANTSEVGQARNLLEDISDRFGYKKSEHDGAIRGTWGDLKSLHEQPLASKARIGGEGADEVICDTQGKACFDRIPGIEISFVPIGISSRARNACPTFTRVLYKRS